MAFPTPKQTGRRGRGVSRCCLQGSGFPWVTFISLLSAPFSLLSPFALPPCSSSSQRSHPVRTPPVRTSLGGGHWLQPRFEMFSASFFSSQRLLLLAGLLSGKAWGKQHLYPWVPWAVAQVGRAKLGQFVLVPTLVPPPCALWLSRGGDRDLALVPVVTFPHLATGWERWGHHRAPASAFTCSQQDFSTLVRTRVRALLPTKTPNSCYL